MQLTLTPGQAAVAEGLPAELEILCGQLCSDTPPTLFDLVLDCEAAGRSGTPRSAALARAWWLARHGDATAGRNGEQPHPALDADSDGLRLTGTTVTGRVGALITDLPRGPLLLACDTPAVLRLCLDGPGVTVTTRTTLDPAHQMLDLDLAGAPVTVLADGEAAAASIAEHRAAHQVLAAAEMVGLAAHCLHTALRYVAEREQFGKPLSTFQSVRHSCAQAFSELELARSMVYGAAASPGHGDAPGRCDAWQTQLLVGDAAVAVAETAIHLHGGRGLVWDSDLHPALRRIWVLRSANGGPGRAAREVARHLLEHRGGVAR